MSTVVVTGGAGFIGSCMVRHLVEHTDHHVVNIDKLTYSGHRSNFAAVVDHPRHTFVEADICDADRMRQVFVDHDPRWVIHMAAESHVDRSIDGMMPFVQTNVVGTANLLEIARQHIGDKPSQDFRFLYVSTDEVYGSLGPDGLFDRSCPLEPNSPYAASKASGDLFCRAFHHTYGFPVLWSHCSNNYGPYQFPEKLIPTVILNALAGKPIPVYGDGSNVRDWIYVEDHVEALLRIVEDGEPGGVYNVGGECERSNIELVRAICGILDDLRPAPQPYADQITFVTDRPGHDARYAIDNGDMHRELDWKPRHTLDSALRETIRWYLDNQDWWQRIRAEVYDGRRLGLN